MSGPDPKMKYPCEGLPYESEIIKRCVFLKHFISRPNIEVGDFTYYDDPDGPETFEKENVLYHFHFSKEKLIIGKFCAIATKTKFIMSSANHKYDGFSSYPFTVFRHGWEKQMDSSLFPSKGDTIVGNDVWFGYNSTIMPGLTIGDGSIIAAKAVVTKDVPPYTIVGGNPAKIIRRRFDEKTINELMKIKWWNWDREKITKNIKYIIGTDLEKLKKA